MSLPYKLGSTGTEITAWQQWFNRAYSSYAPPVDGYYGNADRDATRIYQSKVGLPVTGVWDTATAARAGFPKNIKTPERRPIWIYTAPGSGGNWNEGPSFAVGEFCKDVLKINHQPLGFPKGGYLGLMGGDPAYSYNDVIGFMAAELERQILACPDIDDPRFEIWLSGYSQTADGMRRAAAKLFGDGGRFSHLRSRVNGLLLFGDPSRQPGPVKRGPGFDVDYNPPGWGIARYDSEPWLDRLCWSITTNGDFYACTDDEIRPLFYAEIVKADTELPFIVHVLKVALPILAGLPFVGAILAPVMAFAGPLMGMVNGPDEDVDRKLTQLLSVQGVVTNVPALFKLLGALPGIGIHGEYHLPKPEFGGRTGIQVGCDIVAAFRR